MAQHDDDFHEKEKIDQLRKQNRAYNFLGYEIRNSEKDPEPGEREEKIISPADPTEENDPGFVTTAAGYYGQVLDVRGDYGSNDRDLIVKYRNAAMQPECDDAIEDIVNESIVADDETMPVSLNLDHVKNELLDDNTRELMHEEFEEICSMLDFSRFGHDIFRRWYIDGRIIFHKVIDLNNPTKGIQELRPMNPLNVLRVKQYEDRRDKKTNTSFKEIVDEYFLYSENNLQSSASQAYSSSMGSQNNAIKLSKESVTYVTSGVLDATRKMSLSYLHKALRAVNQLRYMEDAMVINRLARAPQRRLFYIDTGQMNEKKSMEYVRDIRDKYRNKILYDVQTGEVRQDAKHMSMLEDFWLPRKDGSRGTEISTLEGDNSYENTAPIEYFQKKLYQSMNVPYGRLQEDQGFNLGRSVEISRDELKFQKFVQRLRKKFAELFKDVLRTQCLLKNILTIEEWGRIKERVIIDYEKDSYFTELKEAEILRERITTFTELEPLIGTYFSEEWMYKKVLRMNQDEVIEMRKQIYNEAVRSQTVMPIPKKEDGGGGGKGDTDAPFGNASAPGAPPAEGEEPAPAGGGGGPSGSNPAGIDNQSNTGLGGINEIPPPPGIPGEEGEEGVNPDEPQLNTNVEFPDVEQTRPGGRGPDQGRRRIAKRQPSGQGRERAEPGENEPLIPRRKANTFTIR